jgi:O-antigen polymerase
MMPSSLADGVLIASMIVSLGTYVFVSGREGSYLNILTPSFLVGIPAYYLLPMLYNHVFGNDASSYAWIYVYTTLAIENVVFAYSYTRRTARVPRLPFSYGYRNFDTFSFVFLALAVLMYLPVLLQFPEYLLDPRQIYTHTRTGFGVNFYISSTLAYWAVILIQFSRRSWRVKGLVILIAAVVLSLHGSKAQVLSLVLLIGLFQVYVKRRKVSFVPSLLACGGLGFLLLLLFAATMTLGEGPGEVLETVSRYSDYTRNAMLVIDSHFPLQYGRLTLEGQTIARVPRVLMPDKPKNFGQLFLADEFYPRAMDEDAGVPDFGIGMQYADFGVFAIVYLALFAMLRGYLARIFVRRLGDSGHPSDFFLVAFLAGISLFPIGGVGWLLPEALITALLLRFASTIGADKIYHEQNRVRSVLGSALPPSAHNTGNA